MEKSTRFIILMIDLISFFIKLVCAMVKINCKDVKK